MTTQYDREMDALERDLADATTEEERKEIRRAMREADKEHADIESGRAAWERTGEENGWR